MSLSRRSFVHTMGAGAAGVLVGRDFPPFQNTHCRVSIGTVDEMQRAVAVFKSVLAGAPSTSRQGGR